MHLSQRIGRATIATLALALAMLCVDCTPRRTLALRDAAGAPVADAWIAYHHHRDRFNFVDSQSWVTPGGLLRSDSTGAVHVPALLGFKPPLDGRSRIRLDLVYAPHLHHARGPVLPRDDAVLTLDDLGGDPRRWERSLERLHSVVRFQLWPPETHDHGRDRRHVRPSSADLDALVASVLAEYRGLLARHGQTRRDAREAEQAHTWTPEQLARLQLDIAQRPLWGQYIEQRWQRDVERLQQAWIRRKQDR